MVYEKIRGDYLLSATVSGQQRQLRGGQSTLSIFRGTDPGERRRLLRHTLALRGLSIREHGYRVGPDSTIRTRAVWQSTGWNPSGTSNAPKPVPQHAGMGWFTAGDRRLHSKAFFSRQISWTKGSVTPYVPCPLRMMRLAARRSFTAGCISSTRTSLPTAFV